MHYKIIVLLCISLNAFAEKKDRQDNLTSMNFEAFEALSSSPEKAKELLKQLENYESYRPDSWTDALRGHFQPKKYKFFSDQ